MFSNHGDQFQRFGGPGTGYLIDPFRNLRRRDKEALVPVSKQTAFFYTHVCFEKTWRKRLRGDIERKPPERFDLS